MRDEQGQLSIFVVVIAAALIVLGGLVIDGGYMLAASRRASAEADAAARSGAQALDVDAYRAGAPLRLDHTAAEAAARSYLAAVGHEGTVSVSDQRVDVEVRITQPLAILGVIGLGPVEVSGVGYAEPRQA